MGGEFKEGGGGKGNLVPLKSQPSTSREQRGARFITGCEVRNLLSLETKKKKGREKSGVSKKKKKLIRRSRFIWKLLDDGQFVEPSCWEGKGVVQQIVLLKEKKKAGGKKM